MRFSELVQILEQHEFRLIKEKGSVRYYAKPEWDKLIRVDYHGAKEVPTGTARRFSKPRGSREYDAGGMK
jgi:predicted RNA binding protein YcfA (HicA-like mRNA interferase family)